MTLGELISYARKQTKITTSQYSDADSIIAAKIWIKKLQREVADVRQDLFGEISEADIVNAQEDYHLPEDCLQLKKLEVTYNGTDYHICSEVDMNDLDYPWEWYEKNQPKEYPVYDLVNNRMYIAPTPAADEIKGLKFWYIKRPTEVSTTSDTPLITASTDEMLLDYQYLIADGLAVDYLKSVGSPRASEFLSDYFNGVNQMKQQLRQLNVGTLIAETPNYNQYFE